MFEARAVATLPGTVNRGDCDVIDRHYRAVDRGFYKMRTNQILYQCKEIGLRSSIGQTSIPLDATLRGFDGMSAEQILLDLRKQLRTLVFTEDSTVKRRIGYYFQVQMCPMCTRKEMAKYVWLSFVPMDRATFPVGTTFWPLDNLQCLCMNVALRRPMVRTDGTNFYIDHIVTKLLNLDLESDGTLYLGGGGLDNDIPYSRCCLSRFLTLEPGSDSLALSAADRALIDHAITLHADMELKLARKDFTPQFAPVLPEIWLGFSDLTEITRENTSALVATAYDTVKSWLACGMPPSYGSLRFRWVRDFADKLIGCDPATLVGWGDIEKIIGASEADELLGEIWAKHVRKYSVFSALPLRFFQKESPQHPIAKADVVLADMGPFMGRLTPSVVDQADVKDPNQATVQVLELVELGIPPTGTIGDSIRYDLLTPAIGDEDIFA